MNKRYFPSRRDLLRHGAAAAVVGSAAGLFGRRAWAAEASAKQDSSLPRQAVSSTRKEAGEAASDILRQGGNAIDAAIAAFLVQTVIEPSNVSLAGYGGSVVIYKASTGKVHTIDFDARAPRKFDPSTFTEEAANYGYLALGVPGVPAGVDLALREHGTLPFKTVAKYALALAENGIVVTPKLSKGFVGLLQRIDPVSQKAFFPNGVPAEGSTWVQSDYAKLFKRLSDDGPASFYTSDIADTITKQIKANGGVLAVDDFRDFHATSVEPLHIKYRGYDLYTPPLPSGGLTSLSILKTLEQFDLSTYKPWGADFIELWAAASNLTWAERFKYFGDPDFVNVPTEELLSDKKAAERADIIRKGAPQTPPPTKEGSHTVNIVVIDKDQNIVSWTGTHGSDFGSHVAIDGLGLMLGHGMSRFAFKAPNPNYPQPGKRPQHNMSPLLVLHDGKPYAGLGLPGGRRIVTVTSQLAINLIDFKKTPQEIVSSPRIHTEGVEPIEVTTDIPATVLDELKSRGHKVEVHDFIGGESNAAVIDPKTGKVDAAGTPGGNGTFTF